MSMSDPISDMLTRIRNAGRENHPMLEMPSSKVKAAIAKVLRQEGYIGDFQVEEIDKAKRKIRINLKYVDAKAVILGLERISLPSRRVYVGAGKVPRVLSGLGVVILSTPIGIVSGKEAARANVGGELICKVW